MAEPLDQELTKAFFVESSDILEQVEQSLSVVDANKQDFESINALFRGLHTIKGNSSFLDLKNITQITHLAESLLDKARKKEIPITGVFISVIRLVLEDLRRMIDEQIVDLDVGSTTSILNDYLAGKEPVLTKNVAAAALDSGSSEGTKKSISSSIRVDEVKVGRILSLASELELIRYSFERFPEKMELLGRSAEDLRFELDLQVSKLSRLTRSLSSIIFGVRLVPVNQVFKRFPRVVAELAGKLGKKVELRIQNGQAELDKNIVDAIADPMTHLIRNSVDHGIESSAERVKKGKVPHGTITLNSYVKGNFVIVEISDDGKGIDGDMILRKAIEKGIVPEDKARFFTEIQKLGLIFAPGFSTAEKVTDISGRGVGMDVVKSNINKLKGTVIIQSVVGKGTIIQLRFPMSMVVMFSLFLQVRDSICAIPMQEVDESVDYFPQELMETIPEGEDKSKYVTIYSLSEILWGERSGTVSSEGVFHTVRFKDEKNRGHIFLVEEFQSIEEAVVQSLDSYISALPGLQGGTLRKDGSVALVLNPDSLMELSTKAKPFAYAKRKAAFQQEGDSLSDFLGISGGAAS